MYGEKQTNPKEHERKKEYLNGKARYKGISILDKEGKIFGDIIYYFDEHFRELGYIIFENEEFESVTLISRQWSNQNLQALKITRLK